MSIALKQKDNIAAGDPALEIAKLLSAGPGPLRIIGAREDSQGAKKWALGRNPETKNVEAEVRLSIGKVVICAYQNEVKTAVADMLFKSGTVYTDWGAFLHLPLESKLKFPELNPLRKEKTKCTGIVTVYHDKDKLQLKEFRVEANEKAANRHFYSLIFENSVQLAQITALPDKKWVDDVQIMSKALNFLCAVAKSDTEFPFKEFVARELEKHGMSVSTETAETLYANFVREKARKETIEKAYLGGQKLPGWEMTDPKQYDCMHFRLMVRAEQGNAFKIFHSEEDKTALYEVDPFDNPEVLQKMPYLSCSVVDEMHTAVFGPSGFVLGVPKENIRRASPCDLKTVIRKERKEDYRANLPSAQEILERTKTREFNEVVVAGTNELTGSKIEMIGVYLSTDPLTMKPRYPEQAARAECFVRQHKLPLIRLIEPFLMSEPIPAWAIDE